MERETDVAAADRLARKRARTLPVFALVFLAWQGNFIVMPPDAGRTVDLVRIIAWLGLALVLLAMLATAGGLLRSKAVRAMMNDEVTRENRRTAYAYGFWAAVGAAIGLYVVTLFEPVDGREAAHVVLTAAIAAALLNFGLLERRALRDG
jgi:protein-S-isoprenylcysteine O-methyltransferase Ste14